MVTNQWRSIENEDAGSDEPDEWWYYFQSNGKAVKKSGSSDNVKFVTLPTSTDRQSLPLTTKDACSTDGLTRAAKC